MDPDPYEDKYVELGQSSIPSSGEGVFAKRSLKKGMIACFFSLFLFRVPDQYEEYAKRYFNNKSKSDEYRRHCNKYTLEFTLFNGVHLLPPEMDVNPLPNFGPKVNHDFFKNNTKFILAEHPRWGLISSVTTSKDVQAGEELFAHYAYQKMDFPFDHPWYWEAKIKTDKENRLQKSKKPPKTKKRSRAA